VGIDQDPGQQLQPTRPLIPMMVSPTWTSFRLPTDVQFLQAFGSLRAVQAPDRSFPPVPLIGMPGSPVPFRFVLHVQGKPPQAVLHARSGSPCLLHWFPRCPG
jgi:hypothetical protein